MERDRSVLWDTRYAVLHAIYRDHFGQAENRLSGRRRTCSPSYGYVPTAACSSRCYEDTNAAILTSPPDLLTGRRSKTLVRRHLGYNSNGVSTIRTRVMIAPSSMPTARQSADILDQSHPISCGSRTLPSPSGFRLPSQVSVGYDTSDAISPGRDSGTDSPVRDLRPSSVINIAGRTCLPGAALDADPHPTISPRPWRAVCLPRRLLKGEVTITDLSLPVRLLFGVYPTSLCLRPVAGQTYRSPGLGRLPSYTSGIRFRWTASGLGSRLDQEPTGLSSS